MTRPTVAELAARLESVEAELAARLAAVESELEQLKSLRAQQGITPAESAALFEYDNRARAMRVHGYLWAAIDHAPGQVPRVTISEALAICARNGYTPTRQTIRGILTQLTGRGFAAYVGHRLTERGGPDEWALMAPPAPAASSAAAAPRGTGNRGSA